MLFSVVIPIVHVVACLFLIVVVLLQTGKGADMGAVFGGGGSQTLFGSTGAGNLLTKLTTAMAITFMLTSLTLAVTHRGRSGSGLLERLPDAAPLVLPPPVAPSGTDGETGTEDAATGTDAAAPAEAAASDDVAASDQLEDAPAEAPVAGAPTDPSPVPPVTDGTATAP